MNFPYQVKRKYAELNDGQCCYQVADRTGFHFYRCNKKGKEKIDSIGFCGIHARCVKQWREKIEIKHHKNMENNK